MKLPTGFVLFAAVLFVAIFTVENINGRFWLNDFKVYYSAAEAFLAGNPVYGTPFGLDTGYYKYSPFVLLLFLPFTAVSFQTAAIVQFWLIGVATIAALVMLYRISEQFLNSSGNRTSLVLIVSLICILNHLVRELHLGNVNMYIVLLLTGVLTLALREKYPAAGLLLAVAVLLKPYLGILTVPLLVSDRWRVVPWFALIAIVLSASLSFISGPAGAVSLHRQWFQSIADHSSYLYSNHTVASIVGITDPNVKVKLGYALVMLLCLTVVIVQRVMVRHLHTGVQRRWLIVSFFALLALVPNCFITDTEHFLFTLPLIVISIYLLTDIKAPVFTSLFTFCVLLYGANSSDLLGNNLSESAERWGLLGIGNLGVVIVSIVLTLKHRLAGEIQPAHH